MFKSPFSFNGRIRRSEYGLSFVIYLFVVMIGSFLSTAATGSSETGAGGVLTFILIIPCIWFMLAQGAKRSHDLGNSGWFILIPFYGFWLLFARQ